MLFLSNHLPTDALGHSVQCSYWSGFAFLPFPPGLLFYARGFFCSFSPWDDWANRMESILERFVFRSMVHGMPTHWKSCELAVLGNIEGGIRYWLGVCEEIGFVTYANSSPWFAQPVLKINMLMASLGFFDG